MKSTRQEEHRRFTRIPFQAVVTLTRGARYWESTLIDVSLKGMLIARPAQWDAPPGQPIDARIQTEDKEVSITMSTEVAHVEADRVGLRCVHIDLDSIGHLRRLVELNLGNADQLQRELHALGKIA